MVGQGCPISFFVFVCFCFFLSVFWLVCGPFVYQWHKLGGDVQAIFFFGVTCILGGQNKFTCFASWLRRNKSSRTWRCTCLCTGTCSMITNATSVLEFPQVTCFFIVIFISMYLKKTGSWVGPVCQDPINLSRYTPHLSCFLKICVLNLSCRRNGEETV